MVTTADLWVYNAENFCVTFFTKLHPFFAYEGGKSKKSFFWAYLLDNSFCESAMSRFISGTIISNYANILYLILPIKLRRVKDQGHNVGTI